MKYRYLVESPDAAVQLIAASYLRHGYYWYVTGRIPVGKDPILIDRKIIQKYSIDISQWERSHRRKRGLGNAHYLRCEDWFIILISEGHHPIKMPSSEGGEGDEITDCRRVPIKLKGYSISYRRSGVKWHTHVRIDRSTYQKMQVHFDFQAIHRNEESLAKELSSIPFARYAPVRRQLLVLLRRVNRRRAQAGYSELGHTCLSLRRTPVKVFSYQTSSSQELERAK